MRARLHVLSLFFLVVNLLAPVTVSANTAVSAEVHVGHTDLPDPILIPGTTVPAPEPRLGCELAEYDCTSDSLLAAKGGKGLTTPGKFFGDKTAKGASEALGKKLGPPRSTRPGAETFYNPKTGRSYNVHTDSAHGPPHVDIRTRGPIPDRRVPLGGGD